MYLREMGSVELLSREGEIAIAKRIETGREAMIAGLCESPLTFQAIIIWRDELNEEKVFLRDIIDLEATYAGPDAKAMPAAVSGPDGQPIPAAPPAPCAPGEGGETAPGEGDFDDDDMEDSLSLAAIEAKLKPKVLETFDNVAYSYKRLRRLQDQYIEFKLKNTTLSPAQERRYKKLKNDIITEVKSLRLNQTRIDSLVEQLYEINKRLVGYEGKLMRLAQAHGVAREDFLKIGIFPRGRECRVCRVVACRWTKGHPRTAAWSIRADRTFPDRPAPAAATPRIPRPPARTADSKM
jgi:RNA polymerase primary sigma factor